METTFSPMSGTERKVEDASIICLTAHDSTDGFDEFDDLLLDAGLAKTLMRVVGKTKLLQEALLVEDGDCIQKEQRRLQQGE